MVRAVQKDILSNAVAVAVGPDCSPGANPFDILPIFMVQQSGSKWRLIHDARETNCDLPPSTAAYEYVSDIAKYVDATVATKLDLQSAYRNVPLAWADSLRLAFRVAGFTLVYRTLPFGLSWAPAKFLDVVRPAVLQCRAEGFYLVWYMDDILVLGRDVEHLTAGLGRLVQLLGLLGLKIAPDKFYPVAASRLDFIGHLIDLVEGTIAPTPPRFEQLTSLAEELALDDNPSVRSLQRVAGILAFVCHSANTRLPLRALHVATSFARDSPQPDTVANYPLLRQELGAIASLSPPDLTFDYRADALRRTRSPVHLVGDAGDTGWAALWVDHALGLTASVSDVWSDDDRAVLASSAAREIDTIRRAIVKFDLRDQWIVYTSDARAAIGAIRHRGKSTGTARATLQLLTECRARSISLDVRWCSRDDGWLPLADLLGRTDGGRLDAPRLATAEWTLDPHVFHAICTHLDVSPTIDLFASGTLHQLPRFASRSPIVDGSVGDGLLVPLALETPFVFAPWSIMARAVRRLTEPLGPRQAIVLARVHDDCRGFQALAAAEAAGSLHVLKAVSIPHTALRSASGVTADRQLWPLRALLVSRDGPGHGQPLWWTREDLVCVHPNPGPGGEPNGGDDVTNSLPDAWKAAAGTRVERSAPTDPTIAGAVQALLRGGDPLAEMASAVGTAVPPQLLQLLAALHAAFTPAATASSHTRHSQAFGQWIVKQPGVTPTAPWTDDVACTFLAAWADSRASGGLAASSIRTEIFNVRATLRLWGSPIRDDRKVLSSAMFRLGCLRRDTQSAKRPFTFVHLQRIESHLRSSGGLMDIRELMLITGTVLAFALLQRGETIRSLHPRHIEVDASGAIRLNFDGPRKNDQAYKAAAPQGLATGRACALAARLLSAWLGVLPKDWDGPLFPRITKARMASDKIVCVHRGYQWSRDQTTRDFWNDAIKRWCTAVQINEHLTFHCLRVGGALDVYRSTGGDIRLLQAIGGWASQAFRLYIAVSVEEAIMRAPAPDAVCRTAPPPSRRAVDDDDDSEGDHRHVATQPTASGAGAAAPAAATTTGTGGSDLRPFTGVCALCAEELDRHTPAAMCAITSCHLMCCRRCHPRHDFRFAWRCPVHMS
jgi:hypothetical protein